MTRIIYMGTPAFAVAALRMLVQQAYDIVTVVTQPDRPAGRSRAPLPSAVKQFSLEQNLPLWQPQTLRTPEATAHLRALRPDLFIVAAYGEILRSEILTLPPHGSINIHASLLPRHRGGAPVAAAILAGDTETGITLIKMDEGMDTGAILAQESIPLTGAERRGALTSRLAEIGAEQLRQTLPLWLSQAIAPLPQDESRATVCKMLRRDDGEINWARPARLIERMTRAYDPWPGAYTHLHGQRLRIWKASPRSGAKDLLPGTLVAEPDALLVVTGQDLLLLEEVQLEGKRRLSADEFKRGQHNLAGARLG